MSATRERFDLKKAAFRAARLIRVKIHDFAPGNGVCGVENQANKIWLNDRAAEDAPIIEKELQAATADMDELLGALRKYGNHRTICAVHLVSKEYFPKCNCGFEAVLARYGKS